MVSLPNLEKPHGHTKHIRVDIQLARCLFSVTVNFPETDLKHLQDSLVLLRLGTEGVEGVGEVC